MQACLDVAAGLLESLALRHLGRVVGADPHHVGAEEDQGVGAELAGDVGSAWPSGDPRPPTARPGQLCHPPLYPKTLALVWGMLSREARGLHGGTWGGETWGPKAERCGDAGTWGGQGTSVRGMWGTEGHGKPG